MGGSERFAEGPWWSHDRFSGGPGVSGRFHVHMFLQGPIPNTLDLDKYNLLIMSTLCINIKVFSLKV